MRLLMPLLIHDSILVGLILCRSWACSLGSCEFVCAMASSRSSKYCFVIDVYSLNYILSLSSPVMTPEL